MTDWRSVGGLKEENTDVVGVKVEVVVDVVEVVTVVVVVVVLLVVVVVWVTVIGAG